jgi:hypothetical protein
MTTKTYRGTRVNKMDMAMKLVARIEINRVHKKSGEAGTE